jgi:hypothetical protein
MLDEDGHPDEFEVISLARPFITYQGMMNPSSLCYLISAIQQFFMMPSFREGILSLSLVPASTDDILLESGSKFLIELQSLFLCLEDGRVDVGKVKEKVKTQEDVLSVFLSSLNNVVESSNIDKSISIDPLPLCATILDPNGENEDGEIEYLNPEVQMDVSDFLSSFLSQLNSSLKSLSPSSNCPLNLPRCPLLEVRHTLCGEICNELKVLDRCDVIPQKKQEAKGDSRGNKSIINNSNSTQIIRSLEQFYFLSVNMGAASAAPATPYFENISPSPCRKYIGTLQEALSDFVKDTYIDAMWSINDGNISTRVKLPSVSSATLSARSLPPHLLIHLKRFRFDYEKMRQVKVNDRLEFPLELNVWQYTAEAKQLAEDEKEMDMRWERNAREGRDGDDDGDEDDGDVLLDGDKDDLEHINGTSSSNSSSSSSSSSNINNSKNDNENSNSDSSSTNSCSSSVGDDRSCGNCNSSSGISNLIDKQNDSCIYQLSGVIIHVGSARDGHYYSLVRERNKEMIEKGMSHRWFKMDDETVSEFSIDDLEDESFGGHRHGPKKKQNAFILVYDRKIF